MDVENSNRSDVRCRRPLKRLPYIVNNNIFSMETYFVWFSALIFLTELVTGKLTPWNESISWRTIFCLHLRTCAERLTCWLSFWFAAFVFVAFRSLLSGLLHTRERSAMGADYVCNNFPSSHDLSALFAAHDEDSEGSGDSGACCSFVLNGDSLQVRTFLWRIWMAFLSSVELQVSQYFAESG